MATRVADRLDAARRRAFVGRRAEVDLFEQLLAEPELPVAVLFVWGPGGVGKSALLRQWADCAAESGVPPLLVDARNVPAQPAAVLEALTPALADPGRRAVVLVDTYELFAGLDAYLRNEVIPRLPAETLVVLAGQEPPAPAWRTEPGWDGLVRTLPLRNLSPDESSEYLSRRGIPQALHTDAVSFTHGHPLALALVGEVLQQHGSFDPEGSPDVLAVLLDRLLRSVPSRAHAEALEAAAQVRVLTEPLLEALLPDADARGLFSWLRGLPLMQSGAGGLVVHDLAREVLAADLRWRAPDRYRVLHDRARAYYLAQLPEPGVRTSPSAGAGPLLDLMYLHDDLRRFLRPPDRETAGAGLRIDLLCADDVPTVTAMVERHEGAESAGIARYWCERHPESWMVVRNSAGTAEGGVALLAVQEATAEDERRDVAIEAARRQLRSMPPLRPGERVTHVRFWLADDGYQDVSEVQSLVATELARHFLTTPDLAVTLLPYSDPDPWAEFNTYADQQPLPLADFTVGGRRYAVYGHDWRAVPPAAWVALLSQRETSLVPLQVAPERRPEELLVLSEVEFASAVRAALRDLLRPDRLQHSPLLRSRLVTSRVAPDARVPDRVRALQDVIREAATTLQRSPADARGYRALHRAYLAPASSLERAAEALGLPSSTFRRHLTEGAGRLSALLWQGELGTW